MRTLSLALAFTLAVACVSQSVSLDEKKAEILFQAGTKALDEGHPTEALQNLQEASRLSPKSAFIWSNLGLAFFAKGEASKAEECLKRSMALDPKWTDAKANLGALYLRQKRYKDADIMLRTALKDLTYDESAQVHYNLYLTYLGLKRPLVAEQHLRLAVKENPDYCLAWFQLGRIHKEKGDFEAARDAFSKSVRGTCFNNPESHYEIASLYLKNRENSKARAKLLEIIQFFPNSTWAKKSELTLNMIR